MFKVLQDYSRMSLGVGIFLVTAYCTVVYFINAWVAEDAYITFRSIEQLFAGNGPRWNPHERVQAFTHALWFALLACLRLISSDMFLIAISLGFICTVGTSMCLFFVSKDKLFGTVLIVVLFSSKSFVDFSSSGLENSLSHVLVALFYTQFFLSIERGPKLGRTIASILLCSLILLNRHDLLFLVMIPMLFLLWQSRVLILNHKWIMLKMILASSPFVLWTMFSIVYYGFPLPNTAYAKLNTGIPWQDSVLQGITYLRYSSIGDPILGLTVIVSVAIAGLPSAGLAIRLTAISILLSLMYVIQVGGDFMQGRFLTCSFLAAVLVISQLRIVKSHIWTLIIFLVLYSVTFRKSPIWTDDTYRVSGVPPSGIVDEKGFYFESLSFYRYLHAKRNGEDFPSHRFRDDIKKHQHEKVLVRGNIGLIGYYADLNQIIIDYHALSDPFLARITDLYSKRIGHFVRFMPEGYEDTVKSGQNMLVSADHRDLYAEMKIITQGPIWSIPRWQAIMSANFQVDTRSID